MIIQFTVAFNYINSQSIPFTVAFNVNSESAAAVALPPRGYVYLLTFLQFQNI